MTETVDSKNPETTLLALNERCEALQVWAAELVVDSPESLEGTEANLVELAKFNKQVEAYLRPNIDRAYLVHKTALGQLQEFTVPMAKAKKLAKGKTSAYRADCERERRQKEAELREQARRQEEERQLEEAERLEAAGETEAAEAVIAEPVITPPVVVAPSVAKPSGVQYRESWKARVICKSNIPLEYMEPNMVKLGSLARSLKGDAKVAGVEFYSEVV